MNEYKITILGSGTCLSSFYNSFDFRHPSGYLLQAEGLNILLDCGEGIRARLDKIRIDYYTIGHIFISHFHPDHFSLATFLQAFYVRAKKAGERKKIIVYGPPGIETRFSIIWDSMHAKGHYEEDFKKVLDVGFAEFSDKEEFLINDRIKIKSFRVPHGEVEAYSTRFILGDKVFCYSGDSGLADNLVTAAKNSDLFICEAAMEVGETDKENAHLSSEQAGKIAKVANTKALILSHYHGSSSDGEMLAAVKDSGFSSKTIIAKDFQNFSL